MYLCSGEPAFAWAFLQEHHGELLDQPSSRLPVLATCIIRNGNV